VSDDTAPRNSGPRRVDQWVLGKELGRGGNAIVYRARQEGLQEPIALKVLKTPLRSQEPYQRFVREVGFLRGLTVTNGILPLLDAKVPAPPTPSNVAWLAMPIATPIKKALSGESLPTVVEAIASIAETLNRLKTDHRIAHRDIKPGNLYQLDGEWLVGDFGLIDLPDMSDLTRKGRPLGPAHYMAYEMIEDATTEDAYPADVYSLGKTLWVLATEQGYPPPGHQAANVSGFSIADMRPFARADLLDKLIDFMTRIPPAQRPSMTQVATDLRQWQELQNTMPPIELGDLQAQIRAKLQAELAQQDRQSQWVAAAETTFTTLTRLFEPINEALRVAHPRPDLNNRYDELCRGLLSTHATLSSPRALLNKYLCSQIGGGSDTHPLQLKLGVGIELIEDGTLIIRGLIFCGLEDISPARYFWQAEPQGGPVGSIETERALELVIQAVAENLEYGLEAFVTGLP